MSDIYTDKSRGRPKVGQWTHYPTRLAVLFLLAVVLTIIFTILIDTTPGAAVIIGLASGAIAATAASWQWMSQIMSEPDVDIVDIPEKAAVITDEQEKLAR